MEIKDGLEESSTRSMVFNFWGVFSRSDGIRRL